MITTTLVPDQQILETPSEVMVQQIETSNALPEFDSLNLFPSTQNFEDIDSPIESTEVPPKNHLVV